MDRALRHINDLRKSYRRAHRDKEILALMPNGNLAFNDWFVGVVDGKLYYSHDEMLDKRTYDVLVSLRDGSVKIMALKFVDRHGHRGIFTSKESDGDISDKVQFAVYGQRIVKDGRSNLTAVYDQFDDLRHLFRFPLFQLGGEQLHLGFSDGLGQLYRNRGLVARPSEARQSS